MNQYETFICVVENGSYSAAAKRLYRSPSAVSKQISSLEESLNVQLFDRTTRNLTLTEAGRLYYEHCREINQRIHHAESELRSLSGAPAGTIKITWPSGLSFSRISEVLSDFAYAYPDIQLDIVSSNDVLNLSDKSIDFAFRAAPKVDSDLVGIELFKVKPMVCASPKFVARHGYPKELSDLGSLPNILPSYMNFAQKSRNNFPDLAKLKLEEQHRANDISSVHNLAKSGLGAAFLFKHIIQNDLDQGLLVDLLPHIPVPDMPVYLIHRKQAHMAKRLRVFIDHFKEVFLYSQAPCPEGEHLPR